jgi:hypothetical protein
LYRSTKILTNYCKIVTPIKFGQIQIGRGIVFNAEENFYQHGAENSLTITKAKSYLSTLAGQLNTSISTIEEAFKVNNKF